MMRVLLLLLALAIPAVSDAKWERAADGCNHCDDTGTYCTAMWCGDGPEVQAVVYSLLEQRIEKGSLERCYRRCEKNHPAAPTPQPTPTPVPVQCESIGTGSIKTFTPGEMRTLCFTAPGTSPFVDISTQNHGNASCADFWMQGYSPTGAVSKPSVGSQPGIPMQREPGRYVLKIILNEATNTACSTLTFTVR